MFIFNEKENTRRCTSRSWLFLLEYETTYYLIQFCYTTQNYFIMIIYYCRKHITRRNNDRSSVIEVQIYIAMGFCNSVLYYICVLLLGWKESWRTECERWWWWWWWWQWWFLLLLLLFFSYGWHWIEKYYNNTK